MTALTSLDESQYPGRRHGEWTLPDQQQGHPMIISNLQVLWRTMRAEIFESKWILKTRQWTIPLNFGNETKCPVEDRYHQRRPQRSIGRRNRRCLTMQGIVSFSSVTFQQHLIQVWSKSEKSSANTYLHLQIFCFEAFIDISNSSATFDSSLDGIGSMRSLLACIGHSAFLYHWFVGWEPTGHWVMASMIWCRTREIRAGIRLGEERELPFPTDNEISFPEFESAVLHSKQIAY